MNLTEKEYWEWRHSIECMQHAETKLSVKGLQLNMMQKDIEIMQLKHALFKEQYRIAEADVNQSKRDYENIKTAIESRLGESLNGKVIDDVTHEVKAIE